jgi:hypothetical protein
VKKEMEYAVKKEMVYGVKKEIESRDWRKGLNLYARREDA